MNVQFAYPTPWWLVALAAAAVAGVTYAEYRRPLAPMTAARRAILATCRALALAVLLLLLFRPMGLAPPAAARDAVVPILVDRSMSMRLTDAGGQARFARAMSLVNAELRPVLSKAFTVDLYSVGERLDPATAENGAPDARKSDLTGALAAVRDRYRGQRVAGIVLLTDGSDTAQLPDAPAGLPGRSQASGEGPPVFAVGIGSADTIRDREVAGLTAGEQRLDQATIDLRASVVTSGYGRAPFVVRLLANGREIDRRRLAPGAEGAPIDERFTVAPDAAAPTVYTVEMAAGESESIVENNTRSVLVGPAGRRRRLLMIEGAPGFEHSFMRRAWSRDPGFEIDTVGRKGKNVDGRDTFFVQAAPARAPALTSGFPARREDLYAYDGVILANVEGAFLTRDQLALIADFVSERGGGLLVVGGRSFTPRGLIGTPLEQALPVDLSERRGAVMVASGAGRASAANKLVLTSEGEAHPAMRIGETLDDSRRLWSALPALASTSPLGGARPGATVLAVASAPTGVVYPVVAVQRYGRGRTMSFSGEASWRWRMLLPSADRSFEYFWRQAARWLAGAAPDPVSISAPEGAGAGDAVTIDLDVRDAAFAPAGDATVEATLTTPKGEVRAIVIHPSANAGRSSADLRLDEPGLYRVAVEAHRGTVTLGSAARWLFAGGVDREFADPRLNEAWLRRVARSTGGRYVRADEASKIAGWLQEAAPLLATPERRDLWHEPWVLALVVTLISVEWILRRRWGLR